MLYIANMLQEHVAKMSITHGVVYIQIMLLERIEPRILPQIIYAPGAAVPGAYAPGA